MTTPRSGELTARSSRLPSTGAWMSTVTAYLSRPRRAIGKAPEMPGRSESGGPQLGRPATSRVPPMTGGDSIGWHRGAAGVAGASRRLLARVDAIPAWALVGGVLLAALNLTNIHQVLVGGTPTDWTNYVLAGQ